MEIFPDERFAGLPDYAFRARYVQVHARLDAVIELEHAESIEIGRSPDDVYLLVSDIARTGEWSPICRVCRWDDGDGPTTGSWFTGHNEADGRTWQTRSQVVVAERGREFAWLVGGAYVRWGFTIEPSTGGSKLTESWQFRPEGIAMFQQKYGAQAQAHIDERANQAHAGIPVTLAAIKKIAESEG
jgi:hypothetical protein